jgi:predicted nucleotidyltransferase component of viral defense system
MVLSRNAFDPVLHKRYLTTLLTGVAGILKEKAAFKGGTCAAFFYNLPRFSFDLDFDILRPLTAEDRDGVRAFLAKEGKLKDFWDKENTLLAEFDYGAGQPNIKVELNKRAWKNNSYRNLWFLGLPLILQDEGTILTNKLVALTDRKTPVPRDLFDTWFFLSQGFPINGRLIEERTGRRGQEYLKSLPGFIRKTFTVRNILQGLGETLDEERKKWAKVKLIEETSSALEKIL